MKLNAKRIEAVKQPNLVSKNMYCFSNFPKHLRIEISGARLFRVQPTRRVSELY